MIMHGITPRLCHKQKSEANMNEYVTRHEHDAKLSASEERMNAQITRIESKMDAGFAELRAMIGVTNARIDNIDQRLTDYRDDSRSSKWALWAMAITIIITTLIPFLEKYELTLK